MKQAVVLVLAAAALASVPTAAASRTVRLAIVHTVRGCHVWSSNHKPTARIVVTRGTRLALRPDCPMDFDFRKVAGPRLAFGNRRLSAGTSRTIVLRTKGVYKLVAKNVQSSADMGLETLGPDNTLRLTIVVR